MIHVYTLKKRKKTYKKSKKYCDLGSAPLNYYARIFHRNPRKLSTSLMNISQQTNGAHVAATNMTTLMQKNCIKTLSVNNGVVVMGTAPVSNSSMINAVPITATPLTTNVTATNLQTHTMIANASHIQPIQAFQYQPLQTVTQTSQPQYIIYNPSDGSLFRPVVTTTAPVNALVANSIYQPQSIHNQQSHPHPQPTIIAQNSLPKIGAIKATTLGANAQQKVLKNIVKTQKASPMIGNAVVVTTAPTPIIQQAAMNHLPHIKAQNHPIVQNGNANIIATSDNIINTTSIAANRQIPSATNNRNTAVTIASIPTIKSEPLATSITTSNGAKAVNTKNNTAISKPIHNPNTTHMIDTVKREAPIANSNPLIIAAASIATTNTGPSKAITQQSATTHSQPTAIHQPAQRIEQKINSVPTPPPVAAAPAPAPQAPAPPAAIDDENEPEPEIDIVINNVVCSFSVRCHLNLREIALNGRNVEFRRENGMVTMKLRRPYTTASIWSSGRITCTGATSEDQAKIGARRYARCLQGLGFPVRFNNFRVVNVLGTCSMPWAIKIVNFSERYKKDASYEPELHPGVTYKLRTPKATLKIFSTGSITVTAGSVNDVQAAIEHIFPLVYEFRKKRTVEPVPPPEVYDPDNEDELHNIIGKYGSGRPTNGETNRKAIKRKYPFGMAENDPQIDNMIVSDDDLDEDDDDDDL